MKFKYNKQINKRYWKSNLKHKEMFGIKFPNKVLITEKDEKKAKKRASEFSVLWDNKDEKLRKGILKIYKYKLPEVLACYIVTTKTSATNSKEKYILLSMHIPADKIPMVIIHEFSHIAFLNKYTNVCKKLGYTNNGIQELKEVLTVINNMEFKDAEDKGYAVHQRIREIVKEMWKENNSILNIISDPEIIKEVNKLNTIKPIGK